MSADREAPTLDRLRTALSDEPGLVVAVAFGSLVSGDETFDSDIDIAVLAERPLDSERREALIRRSAAVTGRPVDLVDLREAGVPLLRAILREGRVLFSRDRAAHDRLVSRMLADVEDLLPLREHILRERRRRWIR